MLHWRGSGDTSPMTMVARRDACAPLHRPADLSAATNGEELAVYVRTRGGALGTISAAGAPSSSLPARFVGKRLHG